MLMLFLQRNLDIQSQIKHWEIKTKMLVRKQNQALGKREKSQRLKRFPQVDQLILKQRGKIIEFQNILLIRIKLPMDHLRLLLKNLNRLLRNKINLLFLNKLSLTQINIKKWFKVKEAKNLNLNLLLLFKNLMVIYYQRRI